MTASVRILTAREFKGPAWAARYPDKAGDLWVVAAYDGKRRRTRIGPDTPENRQRAEQLRTEVEQELARHAGAPRLVGLTLRQAVDDYLARGLRDHAPGTLDARKYQLRKFSALYDRPLDRVTAADLTQWWLDTVTSPGLDYRTGSSFLEALSGVYRFALFAGHEVANPVPAARERIRAHAGRARSTRGRDEENKRPLSSAELEAFVAALADAPHDVRTAGLLMVDAGLRLGEVLALRWEDCRLGEGPDDPARALLVRRSWDAKQREGPGKSGRAREVAMSGRLRAELLRRYLAMGRPRKSSRVLLWSARDAYRSHLEDVRKAAKLARQVRPKDLRDTFASQLLTRGVPLAWISQQLGHADLTTTARHYARWVSEDGWRNPPRLGPGELPPDLLASTAPPERHQAEKGEGSR